MAGRTGRRGFSAASEVVRPGKMHCFDQSLAKTRHNPPWAFTMQQGPVPTQLCCGTSKLGGAPPTRMKESHEVYEIRQGTSDERPLRWRRPQRYVLRPELYSRLFVCDGYRDCPILRQWHYHRIQDRSQHG